MSTTTTTSESRVAKAFGLDEAGWERHANPISVWTRFSVPSLIGLAVWSRRWIGRWSLAAVALSLVWMVVNPRLFPPPRSTRNWASKGVFGERVWARRKEVEIPPQFRSQMPNVANGVSVLGVGALAYGLAVFKLPLTLAGLVLTAAGKLWYIDRMVLLYEDMKGRNAEYASWER